MNSSNKKMIIGAVICIGIGAILMIAALIATGFDISKINTRKYEKKIYSVSDDFDSIKIKGGTANVYLELSQDNQCRIEAMETEKISYNTEVVDGELIISVDNNEKWYEGIVFFLLEEEKMVIQLPENEYEMLLIKKGSGSVKISDNINVKDVDITTNSGDVKMSGIKKSENINIDTDSGYVKLSDIEKTDNINIKTTSGDVKLTDIEKSKNISIKANSGEIKISNSTANDIQLQSNSGDIETKKLLAEGSYTVQTNSGEVDLSKNDAEEFNIKTNSGDVSCSFLTDKIFITHSNSGDIHVPYSSTGGKCEIKTNSGDIRVKIKD